MGNTPTIPDDSNSEATPVWQRPTNPPPTKPPSEVPSEPVPADENEE